MCFIGRKPLYAAVRSVLIIKINELSDVGFCLYKATEIYFPFCSKLLFYGSVYSLGYRIFTSFGLISECFFLYEFCNGLLPVFKKSTIKKRVRNN